MRLSGPATGVLRRGRSASTDTYRRFLSLRAVLQIDHTELPFPLVDCAEGVEKLFLGMKSECRSFLARVLRRKLLNSWRCIWKTEPMPESQPSTA